MAKSLAVLIVDDFESDAQLIVSLLTKAGYIVAYERVETAEQMHAALKKQTWEIVISDFRMPELDGFGALELLQETGLDLPFIVVSGTMGEETAVEIMKAGAHDYVMKDNLPRLLPAVERELKQAEVRRGRKQVEQELLEKEIQYRNLADSGLALIWTSGTDKLCNYFNEPWLKFTGRTLQQEMGNGWTEGVHPDDFDRCLETYNTAFDKHEPFEMEYRLRHACDEYRWLQDLGTPNFNSAGEFIGYIGHCFDITGRKQAEAALRESEEKYKSLHEYAAVGIGYYSLDGKVISYNLLAARHMGGNPEEFTGKSVFELFPSSDAEVYMDRIRKAAASNELQEYEDKVELPGGVKWFVSAFTRILNSSNQVIGVQIISSDISKNKQAEEALQQKNDELERSQRITVGRELRMIELKKEVNHLLQQTGQPEKYRIVDEK